MSFLNIIILIIITGYTNIFLHSWSISYQISMLIHPILGLSVSFYLFTYMKNRLQRFCSQKFIIIYVYLPTFLSITLPMLSFFLKKNNTIYIELLTISFIQFFGTLYIKQQCRNKKYWPAITFGYLIFFIWNILTITGLEIFKNSQTLANHSYLNLHSSIGYVFCIFLTLFMLIIFFGPLNKISSDASARIKKKLFSKKNLLLPVIITTLLLSENFFNPPVKFDIKTIHEKQNIKINKTKQPFIKTALSLSKSCKTCHKEIYENFLISSHNIGLATPHGNKIVEEMKRAIGSDSALKCASCHNPSLLFSQNKNNTEFKINTSQMSCTTCHLVTNTNQKDGVHSNEITISKHIKMFIKNGQELDEISNFNKINININPKGHAAALNATILKKDSLCVSCHHNQILSSNNNTNLQSLKCIDCHLQQTTLNTNGKKLQSHFFPGSNIAKHTLINNKLSVKKTRDWIDEKILLDLNGQENLWKLRESQYEESNSPAWILIAVEPLNKAIPGSEHFLKIYSSNVGIGHPFPSGLKAFARAWSRWKVTDNTGKIISQGGGPGENDFRGYALDKDGQEVQLKLWEIHKKINGKSIKFNNSITQKIKFLIPKNIKEPLTLIFRWEYQKLSDELIHWAYGKDKNVPIILIKEITHQINLHN